MSASTYCTRRLLRPIQSSATEAQISLRLRPTYTRHVTRHLQRGLRVRNASTTPTPRVHDIQPMQPGNNPSSKFRGKFAPIVLGFLAASMGFYITQLIVVARRPCTHPEIQDLSKQTDVAARYDETADGFDSEVGFSEALMGVNRIRKQLSRQCKGHVLEVSCGTGRNIGYYDLSPTSEIDSITFLDLSPQMIEMCKKKWLSFYPSNSKTNPKNLKPDLKIQFSTRSALGPMPPAPSNTPNANGKYTTILQTMGLCSTPSPHALLSNLASHLDTSNPDSRILLLEHGRSTYDWLNNILDNSAQKHAEIHGCWFNRDIGAMVEEAAKESGLEIVKGWRKHAGTTWVFELKPSDEKVKETSGGVARKIAAAAVNQEEAVPAAAAAAGWKGWFGSK